MAAGPTTEEVIKEVLMRIKALMDEYAKRPDLAAVLELTGGKWRYSWDNDGIHKPIKPEELDMERIELPPYSPDLHCVVEHAVANTWKEFNKRKRRLPPNPTMPMLKDCLVESFEVAADQLVIYGDTMRLPQIYRVVGTDKGEPAGDYEGSGGDWPHPRLYH